MKNFIMTISSSFQFQFDQDGDEPLVYKTIPDLVQVPDPEIDMV